MNSMNPATNSTSLSEYVTEKHDFVAIDYHTLRIAQSDFPINFEMNYPCLLDRLVFSIECIDPYRTKDEAYRSAQEEAQHIDYIKRRLVQNGFCIGYGKKGLPRRENSKPQITVSRSRYCGIRCSSNLPINPLIEIRRQDFPDNILLDRMGNCNFYPEFVDVQKSSTIIKRQIKFIEDKIEAHLNSILQTLEPTGYFFSIKLIHAEVISDFNKNDIDVYKVIKAIESQSVKGTFRKEQAEGFIYYRGKLLDFDFSFYVKLDGRVRFQGTWDIRTSKVLKKSRDIISDTGNYPLISALIGSFQEKLNSVITLQSNEINFDPLSELDKVIFLQKDLRLFAAPFVKEQKVKGFISSKRGSKAAAITRGCKKNLLIRVGKGRYKFSNQLEKICNAGGEGE